MTPEAANTLTFFVVLAVAVAPWIMVVIITKKGSK